MSQRMQSFVLDEARNPYNVVAPGKRPRATLTPGMALKDGKPYLSFAVQGGDTQDQNLVQFFLNMVEFDMNVQQACEAPNINSFQMLANKVLKLGKLQGLWLKLLRIFLLTRISLSLQYQNCF